MDAPEDSPPSWPSLPVWRERVVSALRALGKASTAAQLSQQVAAQFAHEFTAEDFAYQGRRAHWQRAVLAAVDGLVADGRIKATSGGRLSLASGRSAAGPTDTPAPPRTTRQPAETAEPEPPAPDTAASMQPTGPGSASGKVRPTVSSGVISTPLRTSKGRASSGVDEDEPYVMIELNLRYEGGTRRALNALSVLWEQVTGEKGPEPVSEEYATGKLSMDELKRLAAADAGSPPSLRTIYRIWPDFAVRKLIDATAATVKAEPAQRSFNSYGEGIVWAVVDSGIDERHPHFSTYRTLTDPAVAKLHRSFLPPSEDGKKDDPLTDEDGHGTHVAGIIAGGLREWPGEASKIMVTQSLYNVAEQNVPVRAPRALDEPKTHLNGMAPKAKLVSLKVLGGGGSFGTRVSRVIAALAYVREVNAASDRLPRIHGVNLSVGYDFDPDWFACGQSPLCLEVDKLVRSGVVVVVAAGNSGYGTVSPKLSTVSQFSLGMTINDPGNAERAITVGATHRDAPHRYGVSYFSSKGPTGDGRPKPDLVAPGERVVSAAAGEYRAAVDLPADDDTAVYVEDTGTSMAAPHVAGAVAAFLSVNREFVGQPERVKRIFMDSATSLGRDRYFEGAGLVDLMRALQSV